MKEHTYPSVVISKGRRQSIDRRHPWIFSGAIQKTLGSPVDGDLVDVLDHDGTWLCCGHYQKASIMVRILSHEHVPVDTRFYTQRLSSALNRRRFLSFKENGTNIFRLVHGDGDMLPGLIIDCYNDVCVVQTHSAGMTRDIEIICEAVRNVHGNSLKAVYYKSSGDPRDPESCYPYIRKDCSPDTLKEGTTCLENGIQVHVDWESGQKTGFFIDQRENRKLLGSLSAGKTVLNTFCYTGGFSLYALAGGASRVVSVDSSRGAIELTQKNIKLLGGFTGTHEEIREDVGEYFRKNDELFDIVILDPPAFAKHVKNRHNAIRGYTRLNLSALSKVAPGGLLFTFSCSQVVSAGLFEGAVRAAGMETGRTMRILNRLGHPPDHPVSLFHPEGEYLKGFVLQVD